MTDSIKKPALSHRFRCIFKSKTMDGTRTQGVLTTNMSKFTYDLTAKSGSFRVYINQSDCHVQEALFNISHYEFKMELETLTGSDGEAASVMGFVNPKILKCNIVQDYSKHEALYAFVDFDFDGIIFTK